MGNFLVCGESWVISKVQGAAVVGKLFLTREKSCSPFSAKYGTLFDLKQFSLSDELKCEEFISLSEKEGVTLLAVGALRRALTLHCISFVKMMTMIIMTMMMTMRKGRMVTMMKMMTMAGCPQGGNSGSGSDSRLAAAEQDATALRSSMYTKWWRWWDSANLLCNNPCNIWPAIVIDDG